MEARVIRSEAEHDAVLAEVERLMAAVPAVGSPAGERARACCV
ncbi:hypothetical protein [Roseomonas acroporae]|nr:hypothetical protein [Roseomonas acroporae]